MQDVFYWDGVKFGIKMEIRVILKKILSWQLQPYIYSVKTHFQEDCFL